MIKDIKRRVLGHVFFLLLPLCLLFAGCGGGGGGGQDPGSGTGLIYSGLSAPANVTKTNSQTLSTGAYLGGSSGVAIVGIASLQADTGSHLQGSRQVTLTSVLEQAVRSVDFRNPSAVSKVSADPIVTVPGDCNGSPGEMTYTLSVNDQTGDFFGTMNFIDYCSGGVTLSGTSSFDGRINLATLVFERMGISVSTLTTLVGTDSFITDGAVEYAYSGNTTIVRINTLFMDNLTDQVFKAEDLAMTLTDVFSYVTVAITGGRFYHPEYGFVTCVTPVPLRLYYTEDWPSNGQMVCEGGAGTRARLKVLSNTQYLVDTDTDGDGFYDDYSPTLLWADL